MTFDPDQYRRDRQRLIDAGGPVLVVIAVALVTFGVWLAFGPSLSHALVAAVAVIFPARSLTCSKICLAT